MIDTQTAGSPGWWMQRLYTMLQDRNRKRLNRLKTYYDGTPPLAWGSTRTQSAFYQFQRTARTNFAELITLAAVDKLHVRAIRTAADGDESGDPLAAALWDWNGLDCEQSEVYRLKKMYGEAYVSIAAPDEGEEYATICPEDPRQTITIQDPLKPWRAVAALKLWYDDVRQRDMAYLWLPGHLYVAYRDRKRAGGSATIRFSPAGLDLAPTIRAEDYDGPLSEDYESQLVPVVRFTNRDCVGEFETHTDLLDRINHKMLQELVIATLQAFRQRALVNKGSEEGLPDTDEKTGQPINYDEVFEADPGALWEIPPGFELWESQQADLTGLVESSMKDIIRLSAVTRTSMSMLMPDSANQTAEGAGAQRDAQTDKAEYDQRTDGRSWREVFAIAFDFQNDDERAKREGLQVDWFPAQRYSLSEMAAADAQSTLPFEDRLRVIYQLSPREIAAAKTNRADDQALQVALAAVTNPPTSPAGNGSTPASGQNGQPPGARKTAASSGRPSARAGVNGGSTSP